MPPVGRIREGRSRRSLVGLASTVPIGDCMVPTARKRHPPLVDRSRNFMSYNQYPARDSTPSLQCKSHLAVLSHQLKQPIVKTIQPFCMGEREASPLL